MISETSSLLATGCLWFEEPDGCVFFERLIEERAEQLLYGVALLLLRARPMAAIAVSAMALKVLNHNASRGETHLPRSVWRRAAGGKVIAKNGLRPWIVVSANVVARVFQ